MAEVGPGGGGSAGDVTIVFQHQSEQLLGGSQMQRVVEVGCISHPSQTFFQFRLPTGRPPANYTRAAGVAYAEGFSLAIEGVLTEPDVVGAAFRQDLNATGQLLDEMEFFWETPDGTASGSVVQSLPALDSSLAIAAIRAAETPFA